jgi:hypothetical protein
MTRERASTEISGKAKDAPQRSQVTVVMVGVLMLPNVCVQPERGLSARPAATHCWAIGYIA